MIAFLFPGQGSQKVGMGKDLAEVFPEARATFDEADAALASGEADAGRQDALRRGGPRLLSAIAFDGPEGELVLTENTQPAMLAVSTAASRVLAARGVTPAFVAGHSLGEYSANVAAGTVTFEDALRIVRRRGRYMQEAVPVGRGAMAAILGLDAEVVREVCEAAAQGDVVSPANLNGAGQVVIAGDASAVQRACELARARGAKRVVPLQVSAPFHCALMKPAEERLAPELRALPARDPRIPIVANVDALVKRDARSAIDALVQQMSAPVRWEAVVRCLASQGVTTYVEVGPGGVLAALARKIHKGATVYAFATPGDLQAIEDGVRAPSEQRTSPRVGS